MQFKKLILQNDLKSLKNIHVVYFKGRNYVTIFGKKKLAARILLNEKLLLFIKR